jgi:hypothetical protein
MNHATFLFFFIFLDYLMYLQKNKGLQDLSLISGEIFRQRYGSPDKRVIFFSLGGGGLCHPIQEHFYQV